MALERLIADGRIHPARIEETVDKCRRELEIQMKREGEKAVMDLGIHSLHPDLVKLIGRLIELGKLLGRMRDVQAEESLGAVEHGDLGGSGTR